MCGDVDDLSPSMTDDVLILVRCQRWDAITWFDPFLPALICIVLQKLMVTSHGSLVQDGDLMMVESEPEVRCN